MNVLRNIKGFIYLILISNSLLYAQEGSGKVCIDAEPLCGSSQFSYANTSGFNLAETGPDYGCVILQLNPSWFYLQIAEDGDIKLKIEQSTTRGGFPDLDVDFIVYGPFKDPTSACVSDLTTAKIIDCSYTINFVEEADIANTKAGEYYLLLITNFSRKPGFITVTQTAGSATTNCVLVEDPIVINQQGCQGTPEILNATTVGATLYKWYKDDGTGYFIDIPENSSSILEVATSGVYRAEVLNAAGVVIGVYEYHLNILEVVNLSVPIEDIVICDYQDNNDGIAEFNLQTKTDDILNGYNSASFEVTYYKSKEDAVSGTATPLPTLYTNTQQRDSLFVRVENILGSSPQCFTVGKFDIQVDLLPETILSDTYILCVNTNGTEEILTPPVIDTQLSEMEYIFVWRFNGTLLSSETNSFIFPRDEGDYEVEFINVATGCKNFAATYVQISEPPQISAHVITQAFVETNSIEVSAAAIGTQDFEYRLDNGSWQSYNIFENVSIGEHNITVKNLSGCGYSSIKTFVMDYPSYFTPNGDGTNDTWHVFGLHSQPEAKVTIFDRYGKLIKQLSATSRGWDGNFNGKSLPGDDYWFIIEYVEPLDNQLKTFKSHFSLVR